MKEIVYGQKFTDEEENKVRAIAAAADILPDTAALLYRRGYITAESVKAFLTPSKARFHDPFLLGGMREAVERIAEARDAGETVLIFGDYDADGISAASILKMALDEFGVESYAVVPERENGYGLNTDIVAQYAEEIYMGLVITVDCGISDREKVEFIKDELGVDVIVTDHHEIPEVIPDCIVINPKLKGQAYPFDGLCGAGVAYKLASALLGAKAEKFLDIAALATVADSMSLVGENRSIVAEGLKLLRKGTRPAFQRLLSVAAAKEITSQTLAYALAPRVNAAGRMGNAAAALRLFLSEDESDIFDLCVKLNAYNIERQAECDKLYKIAKDMLAEEGAYRNVIMLKGDGWRTGFIGIVAARLAEEYARPVILFAGTNGFYKGSARSVASVNIFEAISSCKDLLLEFGGHSQAAGVAVSAENFSLFYDALDEYLGKHYSAEDFTPKIYADGLLEKPLSMRFAEELDLLEPCGVGNRRPVFVAEAEDVAPSPLKAGSPHLAFFHPVCEMLYFGGAKEADALALPVEKNIVFEPNVSVFNKQKRLKGFVREVLYGCPRGEEIDETVFMKQLSSLRFADGEYADCEKIDTAGARALAKEALKSRYGTAFVFSDAKNVGLFEELENLPRCLFAPKESNLLNVVVIGGGESLDGFDKVIYMDKPPAVSARGRKTYVNCELSGRRLFSALDVSRAALADVFVCLRALKGKKFEKGIDFYKQNNVKYNLREFLFGLEVFEELGIFTVQNGVFMQTQTRSELTNSKVYKLTERILADD